MNAFTTADVYKNQQVLTAPPEQLTLMLYNGAIRFINECIHAINEGKVEKAHNANIRTQQIISELMTTLDMQYDISKNLMALYDYIQYRLQMGNVKKDVAQMEEAKGLVTELRDTWLQAMKLARKERGADASDQAYARQRHG
ncbi:MAG TPA: flagellar export chaperone FliS [Methylomusa anaerophila]|uniref:Flagellar secretion chaperone FliS n=1 Tax=Methylomusa anaerophila TaxID=1930071 RepID=A0A348AKW1_9FIRM|nr:flagellar export chaperone FliS [Methylomusa anaerophila]BBB91709.1 flagellar protein FliS [Methylomusa anaerophila]HML88556.1 flagellar export chaperone FliS [Methylomusa anaerophila]